jgi:hypothetical protein
MAESAVKWTIRRRALPIAVLAALGAGGMRASWWAGVAEPQAPVHAERLSVREVEVVFDPPQLPPGRKRLSDLKPEDLQVVDGGQVRPVTRLEAVAAGGASPWTIVIYFDLALARPETTFRAAVAAAERAPQLADLGAVDVVVAGPRPERLLSGSRDPARIQEVLAEVAAQARVKRPAQPEPTSPRVAPAVLLRQCDRLVTELNAHVPVGPHALLLAADSPWLAPPEMERLSQAGAGAGGAGGGGEEPAGFPAASPAPSGATGGSSTAPAGGGAADQAPNATPEAASTGQGASPAAPVAASVGQGASPAAPGAAPAGRSAADTDPGMALADTARLLSAYGWLTVALPLRSLPGSREPAPEDDMARTDTSQADLHGPASANVVPLIIALVQKMRGKDPAGTKDLRLVAAQLDPADAALVAFVRPTAGTVVPYREMLRASLDRLAARWHLWYQADAAPAGEARPLVLKVPARPQEVRAPRWVRTSIPASLAAARLRRILAGDPLPTTLPIALKGAALSRDEVLVVAGEATGEPSPSPSNTASQPSEGPLRVSFAWNAGAAGFRVGHQTLGSQALDLWNHQRAVRVTVPAPPRGAPFAVLIEDLSSERWGGGLVILHPNVPRD